MTFDVTHQQVANKAAAVTLVTSLINRIRNYENEYKRQWPLPGNRALHLDRDRPSLLIASPMIIQLKKGTLRHLDDARRPSAFFHDDLPASRLPSSHLFSHWVDPFAAEDHQEVYWTLFGNHIWPKKINCYSFVMLQMLTAHLEGAGHTISRRA